MEKRLNLEQVLILAGHICSCVSVFLLSSGALMRMLKTSGELPVEPIVGGGGIPLPNQPQSQPRRSSYWGEN